MAVPIQVRDSDGVNASAADVQQSGRQKPRSGIVEQQAAVRAGAARAPEIAADEVEPPVFVEVTHCGDPALSLPREILRRLKRTVAIAQEECDRSVTLATRGNIQDAVSVEISDCDDARERIKRANGHGILKCAIAVPLIIVNVAGAIICNQDVQKAVSVHVGQKCVLLANIHGAKCCRSLEGSVAISQQLIHARADAGYDDVKLSIPVHISHRHSEWIRNWDRVRDTRLERAVSIAKEHPDKRQRFIQRNQVHLAIPVKVSLRMAVEKRVAGGQHGNYGRIVGGYRVPNLQESDARSPSHRRGIEDGDPARALRRDEICRHGRLQFSPANVRGHQRRAAPIHYRV